MNLLEAAKGLILALNAEAKAKMTYENAIANFSDPRKEATTNIKALMATGKALGNLASAIQQAESAEPVAWLRDLHGFKSAIPNQEKNAPEEFACSQVYAKEHTIPLYTHPAPDSRDAEAKPSLLP